MWALRTAAAACRVVRLGCRTLATGPQPLATPPWFGLDSRVVAAVAEVGAVTPTEVQTRAIPAIMGGGSVVVTGGTGTGKTVAYLAPVCHALKRAEEGADGAEAITLRKQRPRAIVLVPTRELALQTAAVAKVFAHNVKLRVVALTGGTRQALSREAVASTLDIVIATPGRLALVQSQGHVYLTDVRHVVIDEADTLMDKNAGFLQEIDAVLAPLQAAAARRAGTAAATQFVLLGATMPTAVAKRVQARFPGTQLVTAASTHRFPTTLQQRFEAVAGEPEAKHAALTKALAQLKIAPSGRTADGPGRGGDRVLLFCNSIPAARSTAHFLAETGVSSASLHGGIPPLKRAAEFEAFTSRACNVLVCTDAAARGLDIPDATAVINFDFPYSRTDYLHRVGRVARAGRPGTAISFVGKRDAALARTLQAAAVDGGAVAVDEDVSAGFQPAARLDTGAGTERTVAGSDRQAPARARSLQRVLGEQVARSIDRRAHGAARAPERARSQWVPKPRDWRPPSETERGRAPERARSAAPSGRAGSPRPASGGLGASRGSGPRMAGRRDEGRDRVRPEWRPSSDDRPASTERRFQHSSHRPGGMRRSSDSGSSRREVGGARGASRGSPPRRSEPRRDGVRRRER